ncbi:MAG: sigma-54 dependent transcriptional regulator [Myxococcota bacterium]
MSRVLVVEDEPIIRQEIGRVLTHEGHDVSLVGDVPSAREAGPETFDVIVTDLRLPGPSGDALLDEVEGVPIIVITAFGSIRSAVQAIKRGAVDYLTKPFDPDELLLVLHRALSSEQEKRSAEALRREVSRHWNTQGIVGQCDAMQKVLRRLTKVAPTDATVLVLGESGTGKELVARAIHDGSARQNGPFVPVNCAAIPESLFESELFGHERGAFTGANQSKKGLFRAAQNGTIFLDEIGETSPSSQARLLRALQDRAVRPVGASRPVPVDVRIVGATNRDLLEMVEEGSFRRDLYHRLSVMELSLPPLRDRGEDRANLTLTLLANACKRMGKPLVELSNEAIEAIETYAWPGNVRELENALERALILHEGGPIDVEHLGLPEAVDLTAPEDTSLVGYFRRFVREHQHRLSETEIARKLGISRKTLWERRKKYGIPRG